MKIETTIGAFVWTGHDAVQFAEEMRKGNTNAAASRIYYSHHDHSKSTDLVRVGTVQAVIDFLPADDVMSGQLSVLQAQLQRERADSQVRQNAILDQISKLQALEWEGAQA